MSSRLTEEQLIGFLKQAEAGLAAAELGSRHSFCDADCYKRRAKFGGMDAEQARRLLH